ncbi:cation:proton antiporter [Rhodothermaceae bacterium RA]|nr:cation:proton antiporter [Rhodothermaceae bacterium RA]
MVEHILIGIVSVLVLSIGSQWLAWRFRIPSILLLLVVGFLAGPVLHLLEPSSLQGDWLFAFVSLAIGLILFEGGLSLRLKDLREVGRAVLHLITIGVLVTWVLVALAAHFVLGFNPSLSILLGALLTVTGPTVITPLLRHVRPSGRVGAVAKWEGITIDPVGAILAVLVLEAIRLIAEGGGGSGDFRSALGHAFEGLLLEVFISVGVSISATFVMVMVLRRRVVPDYLQNSFVLMVLVSTFAIANHLQDEAGLLTATLMGIIMGNQRYVPVRHIIEFKENLSVLLIGSLFILLSARLELSDLRYIDANSFLFLGLLILVVRPAAVLLSSLGTTLTFREQAFLAWLAPRGIVAAAVAALFSFRLEEIFPGQVRGLVPIVFFVIVGTVAVYGLTIAPVARWLGLAQPNPQGVLFVGAHRWARRLAQVLRERGFPVLLIDTNQHNVAEAEEAGLPARHADALSEAVIDQLDLGGLGRMLAVTPNDVVNSLVALHFIDVFGRNEVYQLAARPESRRMRDSDLPMHLRGRPLFGAKTTYTTIQQRFEKGHEVQAFEITDKRTYQTLRETYGEHLIPLFTIGSDGTLGIVSEVDRLTLKSGDTLLALVPPEPPAEPPDEGTGEEG